MTIIYLQEGDRIGLIRKSSGSLHYFINGVDQGLASNSCPVTVWGVVDLYGMAVKVTILDRNDPNYNHMVNSRGPERQRFIRQFPDMYDEDNSTSRTNTGFVKNFFYSHSSCIHVFCYT